MKNKQVEMVAHKTVRDKFDIVPVVLRAVCFLYRFIWTGVEVSGKEGKEFSTVLVVEKYLQIARATIIDMIKRRSIVLFYSVAYGHCTCMIA